MKVAIKIDFLRSHRKLIRNIEWYALCNDLKTNGQLRPLLVKKMKDDFYEIVDGCKRLGAAFSLGWKTLDCELVT